MAPRGQCKQRERSPSILDLEEGDAEIPSTQPRPWESEAEPKTKPAKRGRKPKAKSTAGRGAESKGKSPMKGGTSATQSKGKSPTKGGTSATQSKGKSPCEKFPALVAEEDFAKALMHLLITLVDAFVWRLRLGAKLERLSFYQWLAQH